MGDHAAVGLGLGVAVSHVLLFVTRHPSGGLHFTSDWLPGWERLAKGQLEIARALDEALAEGDIAAYAAKRGAAYDCARFDTRPRVFRYGQRPDEPEAKVYPPSDWRVLEDGRVRSPGGLLYRADSQMARRIRAKFEQAAALAAAAAMPARA